jgi:hypothetical protein
MVQAYLGDHRRGHALVVVPCGGLTSMAIQMAADLECVPIGIATMNLMRTLAA